jgi:hypothetical protein
MVDRTRPRTILVYEAIGFAAILGLIWSDEVFVSLERHLGAFTDRPEVWEGMLQSVILLVIAATIIYKTQGVLSRLFYLENFLRVCAWCRKIQHGDRWITLEDYLASGFATRTTHGMCPECAERARGGRSSRRSA